MPLSWSSSASGVEAWNSKSEKIVTERKATKRGAANAGDTTYVKKINFDYRPINEEAQSTFYDQKTPTPPGWEDYDGSIYSPERGYGWLMDLRGYGRDRGLNGIVALPGGVRTSVKELGRPTLANYQGSHPDNGLLVFRVDLPDGWYRVSCASVDPLPQAGKPLVDQRSFKCRAHDVVFAGASYGAPIAEVCGPMGLTAENPAHKRLFVIEWVLCG